MVTSSPSAYLCQVQIFISGWRGRGRKRDERRERREEKKSITAYLPVEVSDDSTTSLFHYCQSHNNSLVIMKIDYEIFIIQPTSFGLVLVIAVFVSQELHQVLASFRQAPLGDS